MDTRMIAQYTRLSEAKVSQYLKMSANTIYNDASYIETLSNLDKDKLQATLPLVRQVYEKHLDEFKGALENQYKIQSGVMSAYTLGNWVVGTLQYPKSVSKILDFHKGLDNGMFRDFLLDLVEILDEMTDGRKEWQEALTLLAFPLMNK